MENEKPDIFDRIMSLPGLRVFNGFYQKNKSVLMYLFFGGLTTLISICTFILFDTCLKLNELVANILSWIFAVLFAYGTNRVWVFHSAARGKQIWAEMGSFFAGRLATLGLEELILLVFVTLLHLNSTVIKIAAQIVVLVSNYFISKILVFRRNRSEKSKG